MNMTDAEGNFMLDSNLGAGDYTVMAYSGILISGPQSVHLDAGEEKSGILLTMTAKSATIEGTVTDSKGAPLEDATVSATFQIYLFTTATTDEKGEYSLSTWFIGKDTDDVQVTASKKGYLEATRTITVEAGGKYTLNFQLQQKPWGTVKGRIVGGIREEKCRAIAEPFIHKHPDWGLNNNNRIPESLQVWKGLGLHLVWRCCLFRTH